MGSHLVRALTDSGRRVRVLDALVERSRDDAGRLRAAAERFGDRVELVHADVRDGPAVRRALEGIKRVVHLGHATGSRRSVADPTATLQTNVLGTQALLEAMEQTRVERLLLVSSVQVYGEGGARPSRESDLTCPANVYGASMVAAEALATAWQATSRGILTIVRPSTVYGPRLRPDSVVHRSIVALTTGRPLVVFGTGDGQRDLIHVQDVVRVLMSARRAERRDRPAVFNASTGLSTSVLELVTQLKVLLGRTTPVECLPSQPGDPKRLWADPSETARVLGVAPEVSLEAGLQQTIAWLTASGRAI